jgi:hypothetical protein
MFAFGLAVELLAQRLIVAGDPASLVWPAELRAWPGSLADVIGRVITDWSAWLAEKDPSPYDGLG